MIEYKCVIGDSSKDTSVHDTEEDAIAKAKAYKGDNNCRVVKNVNDVYSGTVYDNGLA